MFGHSCRRAGAKRYILPPEGSTGPIRGALGPSGRAGSVPHCGTGSWLCPAVWDGGGRALYRFFHCPALWDRGRGSGARATRSFVMHAYLFGKRQKIRTSVRGAQGGVLKKNRFRSWPGRVRAAGNPNSPGMRYIFYLCVLWYI